MMRRVLTLTCALYAMSFVLTSCGKKGAPHAPGPAEKITYPHSYPPE